MVTVSHTAGEEFYLKTLLTVVQGPTSFEDLLHVSGHPQPCQTYHDACILQGLLEDREMHGYNVPVRVTGKGTDGYGYG